MTQATLWGYGGGGSMVVPGVSSFETIEWNHRLMTSPYSNVGYEPPLNRMREDIEDACVLSGLDMSLLAVLNPAQEVMELTAGRPSPPTGPRWPSTTATILLTWSAQGARWTWPSRAAFRETSFSPTLVGRLPTWTTLYETGAP